MTYLLIYLAIILVMSAIAMFAYAADKRKAKKGEWRTKEATLLGLGIFGGAVGALIAMNTFRHKTKHWYFWVVNVAALFVHIFGGALIIIFLI